jgi:hypothetical protein
MSLGVADWKTCIATLIMGLCVSVGYCGAQASDEQLVVGEWYTADSDYTSEYFFLPDKTFYHANAENALSGFRYEGSSGVWKVEDGWIQIQFRRHYFYRDLPKRVDLPGGRYDYGRDNPTKFVRVDHDTWHLIGSLTGYRKDYADYIADNTKPMPSLRLAVVLGGRLQGGEVFEFPRPLDQLGYDAKILEWFDKTTEGKPGDWSPEG